MRFDDSLKTVLNADLTTDVGARSMWRQLVDLAGRGRAPTDEPLIARLRMLRQAVPLEVRAASARALAFARPDAPLVGFFAEDVVAVSAPVVRTAALSADDWIALLPRLTPTLRSVLRHRRDLPGKAVRALESFGPIDFALPGPGVIAPEPVAPEPVADANPTAPEASPPADNFAISDLVARIEAFRRRREEEAPVEAASDAEAPRRFHFETDAAGIVIGVQGVARGALVGLSIAHAGMQGLAQLDGVATGGFRRRSRFENARLQVGGSSSAAGSWRLTAVPAFEPATGRFTGFRGTGRRPRADESAAPVRERLTHSPDSLRQLVHELRTPTTAIAGFAEMIESELLGPVADTYRSRAAIIRARVAELLVAIEDIDTASRIDMGALQLRPAPVALQPLIERVVSDLEPLATMRGVRLQVEGDKNARAMTDDLAAERVLARLFATVLAAGVTGETIRAFVHPTAGLIEIAVDRPRAFAGLDAEALFALDGDNAPPEGAPLLGTGFALRVARNLAAELGGRLDFGPQRLTLRLLAVVDRSVEQATTF